MHMRRVISPMLSKPSHLLLLGLTSSLLLTGMAAPPPPSEITGPADPVFDLAQLDLPSSPNITPESDPGPILFTSDDSEETINFPLATPQGSDVSLAEDGRLLIKTSDTVVGSFEQAWALDASGDFLESSYEYVDGSIRQTVTFDENTEFPVLMDPTRELDTQAET